MLDGGGGGSYTTLALCMLRETLDHLYSGVRSSLDTAVNSILDVIRDGQVPPLLSRLHRLASTVSPPPSRLHRLASTNIILV